MKSQLAGELGSREIMAQAGELVLGPMLILDRSFRTFYFNSASRDLLNLGASAAPEMFLPEMIAEESLADLESFLESCFASAQCQKMSLPHRCKLLPKQGVQREIEIQAKVIKDQSEHSLVLYLSDFSPPAQSGQAAQETDHWYCNILDNMGAVIYIKDIQGRYQFINRLFEEQFHIHRSELCGQTDYDFFSLEMADRFRRIDEQVCLSGEMQRIQEIAPHDDGLHHYISVKFPLYNLQGELTGIAGISTDITEQLHAQEELQAAQAVQQLLYPKSAPQIEGYDIAGRVSPAETVSGDFYDYIWLSPDRLVVAVGDVSGHGLGPALEMVEARSYLRAILRTEIRLDVAIQCLNEFLYQDLSDSAFVTLFLVEIDFKTNSFTFIGAGHQAELLKADGTTIHLQSVGLMLGIDSHANYRCSACYLFQPGDLLLITTDGIAESMSPSKKLLGYEQIMAVIKNHRNHSARDVVDKLIEKAACFSEQIHQNDDMTAVVIKRLS